MMDVWKTSSFSQFASTKKWEGEDVDENVADNWDDVLAEIEEMDLLPPPICKSKGNAMNQSDAENKETNKSETMSMEEIRKLQIEADLHLAKEVFGVEQTILNSKEDFDKLKTQLEALLNDANKNSNFSIFSEEIVQFLCSHLPSNELRKIHNWIGNLQIQRVKQERGEKKKLILRQKQELK
uniref:Putative eukaryotic translation initiation factor 3 subunit j n=1 Tax=Rhodnius prolixus TaxID=13249 RepID=A0A4P6D769_RHOPR